MSLCRSNTVLIIIALREFSPSTALALLILLLQDCLGYSGCLSVLCKFYYQLFSFDKGVLVGIVWICKAICGVLLLQVLKWSDCGCGIFSHVFKSSVIASMFCAFQSISFVLLILYSCWYCCEWIIVLISFFLIIQCKCIGKQYYCVLVLYSATFVKLLVLIVCYLEWVICI